MSDDSVTFRLEGELTVGKVAEAFGRFQKVLEALGTEHQANVRWMLAGLDYGSAVVTASAVPLDEDAKPKIRLLPQSFLSAGRQVLEGSPDDGRPILRLVRDLTDVADATNPLILETAEDEVIFAQPMTPASDGAESQKIKSLGTVRGRVETLSHRKGLRFTLYDLASDSRVSCYLQPDHESVMRDAWGRIADVTGAVTRDGKTSQPLAVREVTNVEVVDEGEPLGFLRARGAVDGSTPAEDLIRRIRDAS